jgi:hypothetical protein
LLENYGDTTLLDIRIGKLSASRTPLLYLGSQLIKEAIEHLDDLPVFERTYAISGKNYHIHYWQIWGP